MQNLQQFGSNAQFVNNKNNENNELLNAEIATDIMRRCFFYFCFSFLAWS